MSTISLRDAMPMDATEIAAIYAYYVRNGTATFEEIPPKGTEMSARINLVQSAGYPWRVAVINGVICGYAYANQHKARSAYRYTAENSVYIAPDQQRRGLGRALMNDIINLCNDLEFREMMAVIGDSANVGSISLHTALGFNHVGIAKGIGWKFGRPLDVVYMQRSLQLLQKHIDVANVGFERAEQA